MLNEVIEGAEKSVHGVKRATPYIATSILITIMASFLLTYVSSAEKNFLVRSQACVEASIVLGLGIVILSTWGKQLRHSLQLLAPAF